MTISGESYTSFKAVNLKNGAFRLADPWQNTTYTATNAGNYGVVLKVAKETLTGNRTVYIAGDAGGSMFIKGYDMLHGTSTFQGSSNIAAQSVGQASVSITGVLTSCIVLVSAESSAAISGYIPYGAACRTAGKILVFYHTTDATTAVATVPFNYTILFPQTS